MFNKEEFIKLIDEAIINNISSYTSEEIGYIQGVREQLLQSHDSEEMANCCVLILMLLRSNSFEANKIKRIHLVLKVISILASAFYFIYEHWRSD